MNKKELAAKIADVTGATKTDANLFLDAAFDALAAALVAGEEVSIAGFGKFTPKPRAAKKGRNPATGDIVEIAATVVAKFAPAKQLKDALAESAA